MLKTLRINTYLNSEYIKYYQQDSYLTLHYIHVITFHFYFIHNFHKDLLKTWIMLLTFRDSDIQ